MPATQTEKPKGYLKTTIAMQQHSKNRMNKELLRYSLAQPRGLPKPPLHQQSRPSHYYGPVLSSSRSASIQPYLPGVNKQRASTAGHLTGGQRPRYGSTSTKQYGGPPIWRKSKKEQVDEKVGRLFQSYKAIDQAAWALKVRQGKGLYDQMEA